MAAMLLFYTPQLTNRLRYIAETLLHDILGLELRFCNNADEYRTANAAKINYSSQPMASHEFRIQPVQLLFEKDVKPQTVPVQQGEHYLTLYPVESGDSTFDVLAAAFYLISRYEEYLPHTKDAYGRFSHTGSIAFRHHFLRQPLVNIWALHLQEQLQAKFPALTFPSKTFKLTVSYDIDMAYSYRYKGFWRNLAGFSRSVLGLSFGDISERARVLWGQSPDPFDVYDWLECVHHAFHIQPYYFFLLAAKRSRYDKNIHPAHSAMRQLLKRLSAHGRVGIHPSWQSGDQPALLKEEIQCLQLRLQQNITHSRQHYIRFSLPDTYRLLLQEGITEEFSMGYGTINGFRASVAHSFNWYDLVNDHATALRIHPFCFMDANSFYEQHYTATQAAEELRFYSQQVQALKGEMICVCHNHLLGSGALFKGWNTAYENFLRDTTHR